MESNENITFTTANGHVVVLKPFITGYDERAITYGILDIEDTKVKGADGEMRPMLRSEKLAWGKDKGLSIVVISVDGVTENVADLVMKMNREDANEVITKVNEVIEKKKDRAIPPQTT